MSLCLSYKINLGLSLRKTAQALKDIHGIQISHQMVANYCKTASLCIKPFVDTYQYEKGSEYTADETYIKVRGIKGYIWFIMDADGYSAYPLAAQQFFHKFGEKFKFTVTQVIGLTNDDAVSKEYRPYKQLIERLNRTYKASYRPTNGFDGYDGANYDLSLWVAYYNFLRPHKQKGFKTPVENEILKGAGNMPGKWQLLIYMGQKTILHMQQTRLAE